MVPIPNICVCLAQCWVDLDPILIFLVLGKAGCFRFTVAGGDVGDISLSPV